MSLLYVGEEGESIGFVEKDMIIIADTMNLEIQQIVAAKYDMM